MLEVEHVIICGHDNCAVVKNAMGMINKLRHIEDTYRIYPGELESIADLQGRWERLVKFNVTEQVQNTGQDLDRAACMTLCALTGTAWRRL